MNMAEIRTIVKSLYPNKTWAAKVDRMPDDRVFAIYMDYNETKKAVSKDPPTEPTQGKLF
jgi:hypothetical protein